MLDGKRRNDINLLLFAVGNTLQITKTMAVPCSSDIFFLKRIIPDKGKEKC